MKLTIEVISPDLARKLDAILTALSKLETRIMATLKDVLDAVTSETMIDDSVVTLLTQLHDQLAAAIAANDPAALQAIVDGIAANTAKLAAAVTANTPAP
jgi:DNA-binding FadR family transcriptional regulator